MSTPEAPDGIPMRPQGFIYPEEPDREAGPACPPGRHQVSAGNVCVICDRTLPADEITFRPLVSVRHLQAIDRVIAAHRDVMDTDELIELEGCSRAMHKEGDRILGGFKSKVFAREAEPTRWQRAKRAIVRCVARVLR